MVLKVAPPSLLPLIPFVSGKELKLGTLGTSRLGGGVARMLLGVAALGSFARALLLFFNCVRSLSAPNPPRRYEYLIKGFLARAASRLPLAESAPRRRLAEANLPQGSLGSEVSRSQLVFGASDRLRFVGRVERAGTPCDSASPRWSGDGTRRPRVTQLASLPVAGAKTAIKLMQPGVTRSGGISRAEQFTTWTEKRSGSALKASARADLLRF